MLTDLRTALRGLARSLGFAAIAITALALGIGANTAIFSIVNALLLHPAGIANPDRVVAVRARYYKLNLRSIGPSAPDLADVRDDRSVFEDAALWQDADFNYAGQDLPQRLQGAVVSAEYFDVFGARPGMGRLFRPEEDQPNANHVVVLSYAAWMRVFGGDPAIIGKTVDFNQTPYRVIGVMNPEFRWPRNVDVWAPIGLSAKDWSEGNRFNENYTGVARLRSSIAVAKANAATEILSDRVRNNGTGAGRYAQNSQWGMFVVPFTDYAVGDTKTPTLVLLAAVGLVLLIVCANIAGLMLARTTARTREIAVRTALGASRWQIMWQTAGESLILAAAGGVLGVAAAKAGVRTLLMLAPERTVEGVHVPLDIYVLGFALVVSLVSAVLFAVAPAFQATRVNCADALKEGSRGTTGARQRIRSVLVVSEMALAVVLLVGAGLFLRGLARIERTSPGFQAEGVLTAGLTLPQTRYNSPEKQAAFIDTVASRLAQAPGVAAAAAVIPLPFSGSEASASFGIVGRAPIPGDPGPHGNLTGITPDYFTVMGIPVMRGRVFTNQDRLGSELVTVIDANLARQYWPDEDPIGQRIQTQGKTWRIVGIVQHARRSSLSGDESKGMYYLPLEQLPVPYLWLTAKTRLDPAALASSLQAAVRDTDPAQPVHDIKTLSDLVSASLGPRRFVANLLSFFAAVALALAGLGLYGLISYSVAQQTPEIGIRMALGAEPRTVLAHVVGRGARLALYGAAIGALAVIPAVRALGSIVGGASLLDPWIVIGTAGLLAAAALLACFIPALRATRIDPMEALRFE